MPRLGIGTLLETGQAPSLPEAPLAAQQIITSGRFKHHCICADSVRLVVQFSSGDGGSAGPRRAIPDAPKLLQKKDLTDSPTYGLGWFGQFKTTRTFVRAEAMRDMNHIPIANTMYARVHSKDRSQTLSARGALFPGVIVFSHQPSK